MGGRSERVTKASIRLIFAQTALFAHIASALERLRTGAQTENNHVEHTLRCATRTMGRWTVCRDWSTRDKAEGSFTLRMTWRQSLGFMFLMHSNTHFSVFLFVRTVVQDIFLHKLLFARSILTLTYLLLLGLSCKTSYCTDVIFRRQDNAWRDGLQSIEAK